MEEINRILQAAVRAGQILLENGGETSRVQETINRIAKAYKLKDADTFATPTGIMTSLVDHKGGIFSLIRRVSRRSINLEKVSKINSLSYRAENPCLTLEELEEEIEGISRIRHYPRAMDIFFGGLAAGSCSLLFGGTFLDLPASMLIGGLIKSVSLVLSKVKFNDFFINIIGGALAALFALLAVHLNLAVNSDKVIIGSIMLLVPGITIVNGIRDTISGDLVAGISRIVEAIIVAVAIAAGTGMVLKIWHYL